MKRPALLIPMMFVATLAFPAFAAGKTAKALFPLAEAEARKWQPDSVLVNIDTRSAQPDGTVATGPLPGTWAYTFYSPRTKKKALVMVDAKGNLSRDDSGYFQTAPVGEFSVDSDKAMAAAVKDGLMTNLHGMSMGLEQNSGRSEWRMPDNKFLYYVDANSGKTRKEKND